MNMISAVDRSKVASLYTRILLQDLPTTTTTTHPNNNNNLPTLSPDIIDTILSYLGLDAHSLNQIRHLPSMATYPTTDDTGAGTTANHHRHPAELPPPKGKCPFMTLPTELRRAIFAESLPARDLTIPVRCEDDEDGGADQEKKKKKKGSRGTNLPSGGERTHSTPGNTTTTTISNPARAGGGSSTTTTTPAAAKSSGPGPGVLDLMTLSRALCAELAELVYSEREFGVHVHEGVLGGGGIEFLDSGRQPLQFYFGDGGDGGGDDGCEAGAAGGIGAGAGGRRGGRRIDPRFAGKFHSGAAFGLERVKKVRVVVLPPPPPPPRRRPGKEKEKEKEEVGGRMVAMNTYFMNLALVRLLERAEGPGRENRITRLRVEIADRREGKSEDEDENEDGNSNSNSHSSSSSSSVDSSWWWDPSRSRPRETTFHGISNLQLILLPFSRLRAHQVEILLPASCAAQLASDTSTRSFLRRLEGKITGPSSSSSSSLSSSSSGLDDMLLDDEKVLRNLEKARFAYEAFVFRIKFGGKGGGGEEAGLLGEGDWEGEKVQEVAEEEEEKGEGEKVVEEGDGCLEPQWGKKNKKKKKGGKKGGGRKIKKGTGWASDGDDEDEEGDEAEMQWALQQSLSQAAAEAEKELQQAIRESLLLDRQGSQGFAEDEDRDRRLYREVSEGREEVDFEDDEYDLGLSEGIDEFGFEDDDDAGVSEDGGESDSNEGESDEGGKKMRETVPENDEYDSGLSEDTDTTDSGDDEEYWKGYDEGTAEGRAKAREFRSRRKKKSNARLPLIEPFGTTGQMRIDIWQVTGTTSINSSNTFADGGRFGQPVAAERGGRIAAVEGEPGENMGPYSVQTGWEEEAMAVLEDMTPEFIAEVAGPASGGVASGPSDSPRFVLEGVSDL